LKGISFLILIYFLTSLLQQTKHNYMLLNAKFRIEGIKLFLQPEASFIYTRFPINLTRNKYNGKFKI